MNGEIAISTPSTREIKGYCRRRLEIEPSFVNVLKSEEIEHQFKRWKFRREWNKLPCTCYHWIIPSTSISHMWLIFSEDIYPSQVFNGDGYFHQFVRCPVSDLYINQCAFFNQMIAFRYLHVSGKKKKVFIWPFTIQYLHDILFNINTMYQS